MNLRRATLAIASIAILGIGIFFGVRHYIAYELLPDRGEPNIMRLKNLQLAIQSYAQDAPTATDGRPQPLPKTLQDLVTYGYLRQSDFDNLTEKQDIKYLGGKNIPAEKTPILLIEKERGSVIAEWHGNVYMKLKKQ